MAGMTASGAPSTRVVLVDDHPVMRAGVRSVLETAGDISVVGEAGTAAQALEILAETEPDVVLLDIGLPDGDGLSLLERIRTSGSAAKIVMLTCQVDEASVRTAVDGGASGYLTKATSPREIIDAVRRVRSGHVALSVEIATHLVSAIRGQRRIGEPMLTEREREVWRALAQGLSNADIAHTLFLSEHTVKFHVHNLLGKLGLKSRGEAICAAHHRGMSASS